MKRAKVVIAILIVLVVLAGCVPGPNSMADVAPEGGLATQGIPGGVETTVAVPPATVDTGLLEDAPAEATPEQPAKSEPDDESQPPAIQ